MNKKFKFLTLFIVLMLFIIPIKNTKAATYSTYQVKLSDFTTATSGTYNISSSVSHSFDSSYTFYFHEVSDSGKTFLGYCLHAGQSVSNGATVSKIDDFGKMKDSNGNTLDKSRQSLLKNILASGYQKAASKSVLNGEVLNVGSGTVGTCNNKNVCSKMLATQILVWEVMTGTRTDYNYDPGSGVQNNTFDYVKSDSLLYSKYKNILDEAKSLTDVGTPSSLKSNKTNVLHWNGSKYVSDPINVEDYVIDKTSLPKGVTVSATTGKIRFYSTRELSSSKIKFKLVRGTITSTSFRWYSFGTQGYQDVVMGDYSVTINATLSIKTESGKIKIKKLDENKNELLGSKFEIYKCTATACSKTTKITTVDLTKKAVSDEITLKKSGTYLFKETKTPSGHSSIGSFAVDLTIDDNGKTTINKITNTTNVTASDDKSTLVTINVYNDSKKIKIKKIDGYTKNDVKGATFKIYTSDDKIVKFSKKKKSDLYYYKYDTNGKVENLVNSSLSTYTIAALPEGTYYILETKVPWPYSLAGSESDRKTKFKIAKDGTLSVYNYTSKKYENKSNATVTLNNYRTTFKVIKRGTKNVTLSGVEFELYDKNQKNQINLNKDTASGGYSYSSDAKSPQTLVTNSEGFIRINYLPAGTYYLKETKAADGYVIDETMRWRKIEVKVYRNDVKVVISTLEDDAISETIDGKANRKGSYDWHNAPGEFCFYKMDEDGNYLTSGKFKIQSYSEKTGNYVDVALEYDSTNKSYSFDQTGNSDIYTFSPVSNGETCFTGVSTKGKYRIVEIEAPDGYELSSVTDTSAEFVVNGEGYVNGNTIIINKKVTTGEGGDSQAELIINIQTGQTVVRYGLIITSIIVAIIGLLFLNRKLSKNKD